MKRVIVSAAIVLVCAALAVGCGRTADPAESSGQLLTPEELIETRCTRCHDRTRIDAASHDAEGWARTVDRMIGKGARLTADERAALIEHLAGR